MMWMIAPMALMAVAHIAGPGKILGRLSPASLFIYVQFVMAVGTLPLLEPQNEADFTHGWLILTTFGAFWATTSILIVADSRIISATDKRIRKLTIWSHPKPLMIALLVLSVGICVIYYYAIGYNVLAVGLEDAIGGGSSDIASLRLAAYAGEEYFYPGYVNQFKNALLPALLCIVVPYMVINRTTGRSIAIPILVLAALIFILGTGQRGAFITFMITIVIFVTLMSGKKATARIFWITVAAFLVFFISTLALGRSSTTLQRSENPWEQAGIIVSEVVFRIFGSNQLASVTGFRYIYEQPPVNGYEWWQSITGLLPRVSGSTLSNEIFAQLYGSLRGTAPASIWGATYYNFGLVATLLFAVFLAWVYHRVGLKIRSSAVVNSTQAIGMAGVTTVLGTWVAGSPDYLFNVGLAVYVVLWVWGSRLGQDTSPISSAAGRGKAPGRISSSGSQIPRLPHSR